MFLFGGVRRFRGMGPLGVAFMGYRLWRRLSVQQKSAIRQRAGSAVSKLRHRSVSEEHADGAITGAANSPVEEIAPSDLTSPGTISDPGLEEQRAKQAFDRERESRQTDVTKFEEQRLKQEAERAAGVSALSEPPAATTDS